MNAVYISFLIFLLPVNLFAQWKWRSFQIRNKVCSKFIKKKTISLLFFIFILTGSQINSQTGRAKSLEVGNMWVYNVTEYVGGQYYHYYNVISDTTINNTNYAIIYRTSSGGGVPQYIFERADSSKLFRYILQNEIEITLIDFSLNVGDSLNGSVVTSKSYITIWGESLINMSIYYNFPGLYWYDKSYIEKIGLQWEESDGMALNGYSYELKAALIEGKIYGDTTLVNIENSEPLALDEFIVRQNYPNPFNPSTIISWQSPAGSWQTLMIYDVLGNEVATLVDEYRPAGNYEVEFNAANLPSGIYFYRIQAGGFIKTKKMVLLR